MLTFTYYGYTIMHDPYSEEWWITKSGKVEPITYVDSLKDAYDYIDKLRKGGEDCNDGK